MSQYLTVENALMVLTILLTLESAARKVWPDSKALDTVEKAKDWVRTYAPVVSALVEELAKTGAFPKAQKAAEFISKIEYEWAKAHPASSVMPPAAKAEALLIGEAARVAFPHEDAPVAPAPGNPLPAPGSN